jgi:von Willebrand factor type A domain
MDNWNYTIEFMVDVVSGINIGPDGTHIGVVTFGKLPGFEQKSRIAII